ncbi:MAG: ACT domain-containing protein [Cyanobacteria bacterium J06642_2]
MSTFLLSGFGRDRPGMVAQVTKLLLDLGANLEDTSMTRLGGQFAMLVSFSDGDRALSLEGVQEAIAVQQSDTPTADLHLFVSETQPGPSVSNDEPRYIIRVSGADRPGIVHYVAQYLAAREVNITDVSSRRLRGRARAVYLLFLEVTLPPTLEPSQFARELATMQAELGLDIQTEPVDVMVTL